MILGPDGKPVRPFPSVGAALLAQFAERELKITRNLVGLGRRLFGPDGKPAYNESDVRTGETVHVRLPARFRKKAG